MAVVAAVKVEVPAAWLKGDRNSPEIDKASALRIARAALDAAGGPLRPADLAKLAAERLELGRAPLSLEAFAFEPVPADRGVARTLRDVDRRARRGVRTQWLEGPPDSPKSGDDPAGRAGRRRTRPGNSGSRT